MHRFTCTRDRIVRTDKPAHLGIIVPAVEVIQPRLCIVVVPPVAEGVGVACRPAVGVLHRALAPCVVRIPGHNPAVAGVHQADDITLQVIHVVERIAVADHADAVPLAIVEEPNGALSGLLRQNLTAVEEILRGDAVDRLARSYPVGVIGEAQRLRVLGRSGQAPARPVKAPAEIARRVTDGVVGDGLTVVGRQQITPGAVAVGVGFGLQDLAQSAGCVGVPLDRQDVPCLTVGVDEGGVLGLAVVAYFLFLWCLICLGISLSYFIPCL